MIELNHIQELAGRQVVRDSFPVELALALKEIRDEQFYYSYRCRSFRRFIAEKLPICRGTVYFLISIVEAFERIGYSRKQIKELEAVSWSKLAEALPVLNRDNADYLILKAQTMKLRDFRQFIGQAKLLTGLKRVA